jgi:hypothetical protein
MSVLMELKIGAAIIALILRAHVARGEDRRTNLFHISIGEYKLLALIDGTLYVESDFSERPGAKGRRYKSWSPEFEVQQSPGLLIMLRPRYEGNATKEQAALDGFYLTAFSGPHADAPVIKFTKEPEPLSYWRVENAGARHRSDTFPLLKFPPSFIGIRRDEKGKEFYWALSKGDPIQFETPHVLNGISKGFRLVLSSEQKERFTIQQFDPDDGK